MTGIFANNRLDISEGRQTHTFNESNEMKSSFWSKKEERVALDKYRDESIGSLIEGAQIVLDGESIKVKGSQTISDFLTQYQARQNLTIEGAQNTYRDQNFKETKKSGFLSTNGDIGFSVGCKCYRVNEKCL